MKLGYEIQWRWKSSKHSKELGEPINNWSTQEFTTSKEHAINTKKKEEHDPANKNQVFRIRVWKLEKVSVENLPVKKKFFFLTFKVQDGERAYIQYDYVECENIEKAQAIGESQAKGYTPDNEEFIWKLENVIEISRQVYKILKNSRVI